MAQVTHRISANVSFNALLVAVLDNHGNTFTAVLNDASDEFFVQGLLNEDGSRLPAATYSLQTDFSKLGLQLDYNWQTFSAEMDFD